MGCSRNWKMVKIWGSHREAHGIVTVTVTGIAHGIVIAIGKDEMIEIVETIATDVMTDGMIDATTDVEVEVATGAMTDGAAAEDAEVEVATGVEAEVEVD